MRSARVVLVALLAVRMAGAQDSARAPSPIFVGAEAENYLRYLQTLGDVPLHPWSMRGFSDADLRQLRAGSAAGVWSAWPVASPARKSAFGRFEFVPASGSVIYNTRFPYGLNDGATWAGRGVTFEVRGGLTAKWGPLRATLAPTAFWAENRAFPLMPVPDTTRPFADPLHWENVDRPQRFGREAYGRIDPGQSGVRLEGRGAQVGFSWENRWWGPMSEFPYVLSNNAAGFPHLYFGTSSPRNIWIGRGSALILYGRADQTSYSPVDSGPMARFTSGVVLVLEPKPFPGLEIGAARFFHAPWPETGLTGEYFTHLFETFIKARIGKIFAPAGNPTERISGDNQLASAFVRWVLPRSGAEIYAEYGREDHSWDARDLIVEFDHTAAVGIGLAKSWRTHSGVRTLRFESMNHQASTLQRHRGEGGAYDHGFTRQGHTQLGQLIGTGVTVGNGAATVVAYESVGGVRSTRVAWWRSVTLDKDIAPTGQAVRHAVSVEQTLPWGASRVRLKATPMVELNHNLRAADIASLRFEVGWTRF